MKYHLLLETENQELVKAKIQSRKWKSSEWALHKVTKKQLYCNCWRLHIWFSLWFFWTHTQSIFSLWTSLGASTKSWPLNKMIVAVIVLAAPQNITYARVSVHVSPGRQRTMVQKGGQVKMLWTFMCMSYVLLSCSMSSSTNLSIRRSVPPTSLDPLKLCYKWVFLPLLFVWGQIQGFSEVLRDDFDCNRCSLNVTSCLE